jgi:hypothetical protein
MNRVTRLDLNLALNVALADAARGISWPSERAVVPPAPRRGLSHRIAARIVAAGMALSILTCFAGYAQAESLSEAMARSLGVSARAAVKAPAPAPKQWVCGQWVDLHQGSGKGRTCEWR